MSDAGKVALLNFFLDRYPNNRIVGLELDPDVCARTARRLRHNKNVTVLCGDATELLPADATVLYLANPFNEHVMARFIDALDRTAKMIIYNRCKHVSLFTPPRFDVKAIVDLPTGSKAAFITQTH